MYYVFEPGKPLNDKIDVIPIFPDLDLDADTTIYKYADGNNGFPNYVETVNVVGIECEYSAAGIVLTDDIVQTTDPTTNSGNLVTHWRFSTGTMRTELIFAVDTAVETIFIGRYGSLYVPVSMDVPALISDLKSVSENPEYYIDPADAVPSAARIPSGNTNGRSDFNIDGYVHYNVYDNGNRYSINNIPFEDLTPLGFNYGWNQYIGASVIDPVYAFARAIPLSDCGTPFTRLDPFYQERVRRSVELVLRETDGVSIRQWALESDFINTTLETMDLNEFTELMTHVAIVGR